MILLVLLAFCSLSFAIDCSDCDYVFEPSYQQDGSAYGPGSLVCWDAAVPYGSPLNIINWIGSAEKPIRMTNCGGRVDFSALKAPMRLVNVQHIVVDGNGGMSPAEEQAAAAAAEAKGLTPELAQKWMGRDSTAFGLLVRVKPESEGGSGQVITVSGNSSWVEIRDVEVADAGFAGIMAKNDPQCGDYPFNGDSGYVMEGLLFHRLFIHDSGGEGFYIGNSFWSGGHSRTCDGVKVRIKPHPLRNVVVKNNVLLRCGWECIQIGSANPWAANYPDHQFKNFIIQVGEGSGGGVVDGNLIIKTVGNSIVLLGSGDVIVKNNVAMDNNFAIFGDDRGGTVPGTLQALVHNSFYNSRSNAIRWYNQLTETVVANNLLHGFGLDETLSTNDRAAFRWLVDGAETPPVVEGNQEIEAEAQLTYAAPVLDSAAFRPPMDGPTAWPLAQTSAWCPLDALGSSRVEATKIDVGAIQYQFIEPPPPTDAPTPLPTQSPSPSGGQAPGPAPGPSPDVQQQPQQPQSPSQLGQQQSSVTLSTTEFILIVAGVSVGSCLVMAGVCVFFSRIRASRQNMYGTAVPLDSNTRAPGGSGRISKSRSRSSSRSGGRRKSMGFGSSLGY